MKKRYSLAAAVFAAVLALSATACGARTDAGSEPDAPSSEASSTPNTTAAPDPFEVYKQAAEATDARQSGKDSMKMEFSYDMSGVSVTVKATQELIYTGKTLDDEILMNMQMELMGQNIINTTYYKDRTAYISALGQKMKGPIVSQEELNEALGLTEDSASDLELTEENFQDATFADEGDGVQTLTASLSGDKAVSLSKELLESMDFASDSVEVDTFSLTMKIRDEAMESIKLDIKVKAPMEMPDINDPTQTTSTQTEIIISAEMTYSAPGETVTIDPPADLDTYVDMSGTAA